MPTQNAAFPRIDFPGYGGLNSSDPRRVQNIGSSFFTDRIRDKPWKSVTLSLGCTGDIHSSLAAIGAGVSLT